jgi:mRNA-degrading endonuclease toxin of MazEF toxin-antitoxin module
VSPTPLRGHVYRITVAPGITSLGVVLTNNPQNRRLSECGIIEIRAATGMREAFPGWVRLKSGDSGLGYAVCNLLVTIDREDLLEDIGQLAADTLLEVEKAVRMAYGL